MAKHRKEKVRRRPQAAVVLPVATALALAGLFGGHVAFGGPPAHLAAEVGPGPATAAPTTTPTPTPVPAPKPIPTPVPKPKPAPAPKFVSTLRLGAHGAIVKDVQQRLVWTGARLKVTGVYDASTVTAVKKFEAKQSYYGNGRVDRRTYERLVAVTKRGAGLDPRCEVVGAVLCIDKSQKVLRYLVDGKLTLLVDVRFGSAELPTREGLFHVFYKSRYHVSNLFHTPMPYAMFFSGGQAVHYSKYFAAVGYNGHSHGCVNVRDLAAVQTLFDEIPVGTRVVIYRTV